MMMMCSSTVSAGSERQLLLPSALRQNDDHVNDVTQFTRYPGNGASASSAAAPTTSVSEPIRRLKPAASVRGKLLPVDPAVSQSGRRSPEWRHRPWPAFVAIQHPPLASF